MKQKLYIGALTMLLAFGGFIGFKSLKSSVDKHSNANIANIEALAQNETPSIPCKEEPGSTCAFPVEDANGRPATAQVPGHRRVW